MPQTPLPLESLSPCNLLICEDRHDNILFISALTKLLGCEITTARNGKEAVEICQTSKFDVILMDLAMPIMGGLEASKSITTSDNPNKSTPIVAVTADNDPIVKAGCSNFGINYYLTKPICKSALHRILSECKAAVAGDN